MSCPWQQVFVQRIPQISNTSLVNKISSGGRGGGGGGECSGCSECNGVSNKPKRKGQTRFLTASVEIICFFLRGISSR